MADDHTGGRVGKGGSSRPKTWQEAAAARRRPEEWFINDYAVVQATMGKFVTGLAFLAVMWSTVVLLGGFITTLGIKDFWALTVISFVLASTVLTVYDIRAYYAMAALKTGLGLVVDTNRWYLDCRRIRIACALAWVRYALGPIKGFCGCIVAAYMRLITFGACVCGQIFCMGFVCGQRKIHCGTIAAAFLQLLTFGAYALYGLGPILCLVYSVLRLMEHDYGDADGVAANKSKLRSALLIFYSLVLLQTICFYIWMILQVTLRFRQVDEVSRECGFEEPDQVDTKVKPKWGPGVVFGYLRETKVKCANDLRLPSDWNLMTYAVGLLETASPDDQLTAARVLDALGRKGVSVRHELQSSRRSIENLVGMLGRRSPDGREIRERAARIIADVSGELHIAQFPGALQCISSLLDASQQQYDQGETLEHDLVSWIRPIGIIDMNFLPKELLSQGVRILERLTQDQDNCREICRNQGLLSQITAPITSKTFLGTEYDKTWVDILSRSLSIVNRLVSTPGEACQSLRHEIGRSKEAAHNMLGILESENNGYLRLQEQAIEILAEVALDMPTVTTKSFIRMLRCIFLDDADDSSRMRKKAGEALAKLLCVQDASNSKAILEMFWENGMVAVEQDPTDSLEEATRHGNVVHQLTDILVKNKTCQISAAEILERLCSHFTKYRELPKQDVIDLLTKVLDQVQNHADADADPIPHVLDQVQNHADAGASNSSTEQNNIESQSPTDADRSNSSSKQNDQQSEERKLLAALLSLTTVICDQLIDADDFARVVRVNEALVKTLRVIIDNNSDTTTDCLKILKLITQVVITTIRRKLICIEDFEKHNFKESLSMALKRMSQMSDLDNCMLFSRNNLAVVRHFGSVYSLVKKAQVLLDLSESEPGSNSSV